MAVPLTNLVLPTYVVDSNHENYNQELNQTLQEWFPPVGWVFPPLTNAQVAAYAANIPVRAVWFNTDLAKLQVMTAPGVVQTITSA
jgi:hypothetical protein